MVPKEELIHNIDEIIPELDDSTLQAITARINKEFEKRRRLNAEKYAAGHNPDDGAANITHFSILSLENFDS